MNDKYPICLYYCGSHGIRLDGHLPFGTHTHILLKVCVGFKLSINAPGYFQCTLTHARILMNNGYHKSHHIYHISKVLLRSHSDIMFRLFRSMFRSRISSLSRFRSNLSSSSCNICASFFCAFPTTFLSNSSTL